jgi:phage N-6-adenine-methyltransferase
VEGYHQLGERIVTDENYQKEAKGNKSSVQDLAQNLRISERTIYYAIQFYEKYPDLSTVPEGKNISWNKIVTKYLPTQVSYSSTKDTEIMPEGKYNVVAIDPLWNMEKDVVDVIRAKQAMNITTYSHNSLEYYTPSWVLDAARLVMGGIDLDPASCIEAQENVKASIYYTKEEDGLIKKWHGRVWLNPPYSKTNGRSNQEIWSSKLIEQYECGNVDAALLLVKAALGYKWFEELFDKLPVCFLSNRLSFILEDGNDEGQSKQGTAIFYLGDDFERFFNIFRKYGRVIPNTEELDALLR